MAIPTGTRLGPYEVLAPLGAGGMGEVYKARDTRLTRTVAIKVLPADATSDPASRARFEREARAIATLSHPHICVVYDVGHQAPSTGSGTGIDYLVMELLDGETLAERIARAKGPLPLAEVLTIGAAIADALDRAHRAGIVHRDLKPLNVMLTKSGPKLLDFGLAKLHNAAAPVALSDETGATTVGPGTAKGTILGTIHYMSPEQLEGREADARSDIWALGAVLYEMATGQRPFAGDSPASVLGAIMQATPPALSARQPLTPPLFDRIVQRCLAKSPDDRCQSAKDLRDDLQWVAGSHSQLVAVPQTSSSPRRSNRLPWLVAALATLVAIGASSLQVRSGGTEPPLTSWLSIPPPSGRYGERLEVSVSPDGRKVAFFAPDTDGVLRLFVRPLDSPTWQVLAGTEGANPGNGAAAWSPDGKSLAFFARGKLLRVDIGGGTPQMLADAPGSSRGVSWGPGGSLLFVPSAAAGVYQVAASGGAASRIPLGRLDSSAQFPSFLPDGRHFLFSAIGSMAGDDAGAWVASIDGSGLQRISSLISTVTYARGYLFFGQGAKLFAQPFDPARLATAGEPVRVTDGLGSSGGSADHFAYAVSPDGTIVYASTSYSPRSQLTWYSRSGATLGVLGDPGVNMGFAPAPDWSRVALEKQDSEANLISLWLLDVPTGTPVLFSRTGQQPRWSPLASDHLLFRLGNTVASGDIQTANSQPVSLAGLPARPNLMEVSPDGRLLLVRVDMPKTLADLWIVALDHVEEAKPFLATPASEFAGRFSPDGRWIAYSSDESGRSEIYAQRFPGGGATVRVSPGGGSLPEWARNGRELYYLSPGNQLMAASVDLHGDALRVGSPVALFDAPPIGGSNSNTQYRREYVPSADGQRFLINAVLPEKIPPTITVIQNWTPPQH